MIYKYTIKSKCISIYRTLFNIMGWCGIPKSWVFVNVLMVFTVHFSCLNIIE